MKPQKNFSTINDNIKFQLAGTSSNSPFLTTMILFGNVIASTLANQNAIIFMFTLDKSQENKLFP